MAHDYSAVAENIYFSLGCLVTFEQKSWMGGKKKQCSYMFHRYITVPVFQDQAPVKT